MFFIEFFTLFLPFRPFGLCRQRTLDYNFLTILTETPTPGVMTSRQLKWLRKTHRWLVLGTGLPFLLWALGGSYFSLLDIHYIHGETLLNRAEKIQMQRVNYSMAQLQRDFPNARQVSLYSFEQQPYWQFTQPSPNGYQRTMQILNASTGKPLKTIDKPKAVTIARSRFSGEQPPASVQLITENPPFELSARHLPVWQVSFGGWSNPTLYISQTTGRVVTQRHLWWRTFDVFWRLHILDVNGEQVQNRLLTVTAILALLTALAGVLLTVYLVWVPMLNSRRERWR